MIIAFCDDDPVMRRHIRQTVCLLFEKNGIQVECREYAGAGELLKGLADAQHELLFLDIDLPDADGVRFGEQLRQTGINTEIIFVSNMDDRVYDVFGIRPLSFIRKSRFDNEIEGVIKNYITLKQQNNPQLLLNDADGKTISLTPDKIMYIESAGKLQKVFLEGYSEPMIVRAVLRELDRQLMQHGFVRIHKGFLVNYRFIQKITSRSVFLDSGISLPVGRDRLQEVRERYLQLMKWKGFGTTR